MKNNNFLNIKNFMGVFPNAASKKYCEEIIEWFEYNSTIKGTGGRGTQSRQEAEPGISKIQKDSEIYWLNLNKEGMSLQRDHPIIKEFGNIVWKAYNQFKEVYGTGLDQLGLHKLSPNIKIQRYKPTQGYHVWHSDTTTQVTSPRMLVCTLYLNTVEKGGETEFLYQQERVAPVQGTLTLFPTAWTHLHRGNPPLSGNKYIMNTWLEFVE